MIQIVSPKNICNGKIITKEETADLLEQDNIKLYEVIRVIDDKPVFLKEHFNRLTRSIELSKIKNELNYEKFKNSIELLIKNNELKCCNIRVSYFETKIPILLMYFIKSSYPAKELYETGIEVVTVKKHRSTPNVKKYEEKLKGSIAEILSETKAFEAILINDDGLVSEGSRSNLFFVENDILVTSSDSSVLLGVTRNKVIEVSNNNNINIIKRDIYFDEIKNFDGAFITGTSINVLPIKKINELEFNSCDNEIIKKISQLYLNELEKNVKPNTKNI